MLQAKWFKQVILSKGPKRQNGIEMLREGRGKGFWAVPVLMICPRSLDWLVAGQQKRQVEDQGREAGKNRKLKGALATVAPSCFLTLRMS